MDLVFALSATSGDADTNFKLMKDTITDFADMYGMSRINYALIAYAQTPRKWLDFQSQPLNLEALKNLVDGIPRERGVVALDKVLEEARKLFEGSRSRARKVGKIYIPTLRDLISCSDCFNFKFLGAQANWWHPCRKWPMSRFES